MTKHEIKTLGTLLAEGGVHASAAHMGRLAPGEVRKSTVHRLYERGLVEPGPAPVTFRVPAGYPTGHAWYATAAGCAAWRAAAKMKDS